MVSSAIHQIPHQYFCPSGVSTIRRQRRSDTMSVSTSYSTRCSNYAPYFGGSLFATLCSKRCIETMCLVDGSEWLPARKVWKVSRGSIKRDTITHLSIGNIERMTGTYVMEHHIRRKRGGFYLRSDGVTVKQLQAVQARQQKAEIDSNEKRENVPGSSSRDEDEDGNPTKAKVFATIGVAAGMVMLVIGATFMKDQIRMFLDFFIGIVDDWGPLGYAAYAVVYAALELLAVPAIPLTMTAGIIFGVGYGTAVVSIAATLAATGAFLISRYVARDRVAAMAKSNPRFAAIDRAIGKDGFRVVALLRLSPLLPLAASNYLYGLTSVDLKSYVLASWLGMLPGTFAYVAAGTYGKDFLLGEGTGVGSGGVQLWQVAIGIGVTAIVILYMGRLAKKALADVDIDAEETSKH